MKVWKSVEATGELSPRSMWWAGLLMRNIGRCESKSFIRTSHLHTGGCMGYELMCPADILLDLYVKLWDARPDSSEIGQQVVLLSVSLWNTSLMCSSSRKMFNLLKTTTWARLAAWAEWADVSCRADSILCSEGPLADTDRKQLRRLYQPIKSSPLPHPPTR